MRNDDTNEAAQLLLDALGEDVRRGVVTPLNAIASLLKERDVAHEAGIMGTEAFAEGARRLARLNDALLMLIRAAYRIPRD